MSEPGPIDYLCADDLLVVAAGVLSLLGRNHALVDGNKRLAWSATRAFCLLNGRDIR